MWQWRPGASTTRASVGGQRLPLQRPAAPAAQYAASFAAGAAASIAQPPAPMDQRPDQLTRVATWIRVAQAAQDQLKSIQSPSPGATAACDAIKEACLKQMAVEMNTL